MKIRFTNPNSTKFGKEEHVENNVGKTLIALGEAEQVAYKGYQERLASEEKARQAFLPVTVDAKVTWQVAKSPLNSRWALFAKCSRSVCSSFYFDGDPNAVENLVFTHSCGGHALEKVPSQIAHQYKTLFAPVMTLGADEVAYHRGASGAGASKLDHDCNEYIQRPGFVSDTPARDWSKG